MKSSSSLVMAALLSTLVPAALAQMGPPMGPGFRGAPHLPPPLLVVHGVATCDDTSHPCHVVVAPQLPPPRPADLGWDDENDEVASEDGSDGTTLPPLGGVLDIAGHPHMLTDVEVTIDEDEDTTEDTDEATDDDAERPPRKRITAVTATLCLPPRPAALQEAIQNRTAPELEEIGTLSLTIEPKTLDDGRVVPYVTGTAVITIDDEDRTFTIEGGLMGPPPRRPGRADVFGGSLDAEACEASTIDGGEVDSALEGF